MNIRTLTSSASQGSKYGFRYSNVINALSSIVRRDTNVSGVNPRRPVTHEELTQHNTRFEQSLIFELRTFFRESCWVAFNGMVYNCTPYMEYHPGGGDELMKSAGKLPPN